MGLTECGQGLWAIGAAVGWSIRCVWYAQVRARRAGDGEEHIGNGRPVETRGVNAGSKRPHITPIKLHVSRDMRLVSAKQRLRAAAPRRADPIRYCARAFTTVQIFYSPLQSLHRRKNWSTLATNCSVGRSASRLVRSTENRCHGWKP